MVLGMEDWFGRGFFFFLGGFKVTVFRFVLKVCVLFCRYRFLGG